MLLHCMTKHYKCFIKVINEFSPKYIVKNYCIPFFGTSNDIPLFKRNSVLTLYLINFPTSM